MVTMKEYGITCKSYSFDYPDTRITHVGIARNGIEDLITVYDSMQLGDTFFVIKDGKKKKVYLGIVS